MTTGQQQTTSTTPNPKLNSEIVLDPIPGQINPSQDLPISGKIGTPPAGSSIYLYYSLTGSTPSYTQVNGTGIPISANQFSTTIGKGTFQTRKSYQLLASYGSSITAALQDRFHATAKFNT